MHSFTAVSGTTYFYNGDFSGSIRVDLPLPDGEVRQVHIPFDDIRDLVALYKRAQLINKIENATTTEIEAM